MAHFQENVMAKQDKSKKKDKKQDKKDQKDKTPKVTPSKKKDKGQNDIRSKARSLIMKHPEVTQNARGLFRNENGKTIVEEIVPRDDVKVKESITPRNQYDLTNDDLRSISVHASSLVDDGISKYDPDLAKEEALAMAIRSMEDGKYDGRVNASTFQLILDNMGKVKKAFKEDQPEEQKSEDQQSEEQQPEDQQSEEDRPGEAARERYRKVVKKQQGQREKVKEQRRKRREEQKQEQQQQQEQQQEDTRIPEEEKMNKETLKKEREALKKKLAALEVLMGDESDEDLPTTSESATSESEEDEVEARGFLDDDHGASVTESLDNIAGELEKEKDPELFKIAYQLDQISDILEGKREASAIISEPDESYMKAYFKAGLREGEADEKSYMNEFNTDVSKEVESVKDKKNGKEASEKRPYQKI